MKGAKDLVLWLDGSVEMVPGFIIHGCSDANWAANKSDRRRLGAYMFYFNGLLVSYCSKKQAFVATASCESEYMAAIHATKEAIWLQNIVYEISLRMPELAFINSDKKKLKRQPIRLLMDNMSAIRIAKNLEFYSRSKHIDIAVHFIRQRIELKQIDIHYKKTEDMTADFLTKPLATLKFLYCRDKAGRA